MFIQTESTPNPATLKFLPGLTVLDAGTADFPAPETAAKSPLARRIFAVDGVAGVFLGSDFVTVTKAEAVRWEHIKPAVLGAIMEHFQSGAPVIEGERPESAHAEQDGPDGDIVRQIKELLDTRVRPAVAQVERCGAGQGQVPPLTGDPGDVRRQKGGGHVREPAKRRVERLGRGRRPEVGCVCRVCAVALKIHHAARRLDRDP